MDSTEAQLVARVIQFDDRHAFAQLVRQNQSTIRNVLRKLTCGDESLADDLAQETFIRAYRGLRKFRGGARFSTWLYRIAYNVFLNEVRRQASRAGEAASARDSAELADPDRGLAKRAALRQDLDEAMMHLTPQQRAALVLAYGNDATHAEIAEILECPLGTVKTLLLRGKRELGKRLRDWDEGDEEDGER